MIGDSMISSSYSKGDKTSQLTRSAFVWSRILDTPFWAIFNMLPFILYKDLHVTPLQLAAIITLKPLTSIFSMYWSALTHRRHERLLPNIIWGGVLRHLPFFFFPFVDNPWFFIASFGFHMMLSRGTQPAWLEILKINIPGVSRERVFAYGSVLGYIGDAIFPFALGWLLDGYFQAWRWIFPVSAIVSLMSLLWQVKIPVKCDKTAEDERQEPFEAGWKQLLKPWQESWSLMFKRPDFARFQIGFMLGGAGLMVMQPALPIYFVDKLNLSYTELAVALTTFKGIGFTLSTPFWTNLISKVNMYRFTSWVTLLISLFAFCVMMSQLNPAWLYLGYLTYGIMQSGSNLSWNMSGPMFSQAEDSSIYSSVNVVTVGLRGCFAPALGSLLCAYGSATYALILGGCICLLATQQLTAYSREFAFPSPKPDAVI